MKDSSALPTILIVEDSSDNLRVLGELLQPYYRVRAVNSGERALAVAKVAPFPDLILLDVVMPGIDGYEVLRRLREGTPCPSPVIFVTALDASTDEEYGLSLGAVDYITKPLNPALVLARVRTHLELKKARDLLARENERLEVEMDRRLRENKLIHRLSVQSLACVAEARDDDTGHHIVRIQAYLEVLCRHLAEHPRFREALADQRAELMVQAAPLHDLGKVGIPDSILLKPGRLTTEEFEVMKTHTVIGAGAIRKALNQTLEGVDPAVAEQAARAFGLLGAAEEIALSHHERWDGTGYPQGLKGDEIPVSGRLTALPDVFDALVTRRVYKPALGFEEACEVIQQGRGTHFDPDVVDAFWACRDEFAAIVGRSSEAV